MTVNYHPQPGTIVICDFSSFISPEMTKRRPAVVVSPRFRTRDQLCTVVPLSTTTPRTPCAYHCRLTFDPPLPAPWDAPEAWVKADMLYTVAFHRLRLPFAGKDAAGQRIYDVRHLSDDDMQQVRRCMLHGLGLAALTTHL